jgi:uncharacterized lipoprotein YmbA
MMMRRSILFAPFLLAGCGFLSSKPSTFYSLDLIPPQSPVAIVRGLPIGIDVVLPPGLNRKELVVRQANHQLKCEDVSSGRRRCSRWSCTRWRSIWRRGCRKGW